MDKIDIQIGAKDTAKGPIEAVRNSLHKLTHSFSSAIKGSAGMIKTGVGLALGFGALKVAIGAAKAAFDDSIGGAMAYQSAVENLHASLASAGNGTAAATKQATDFANAVEAGTTYTRDQIIAAQSLGATIGGFTGPALNTATKAAIGLAQKLHVDLPTAMKLVARAAHGQNTQFSRYGITIDKTKTAQQQFNQVIQAGLGSFSLATAQTKTLAGSWSNFKNQMESSLQDAMKPVIGVLTSISEKLAANKPLIHAFGALFSASIKGIMSVMESFGKVFGGMFGTGGGGVTQLLLKAAYAFNHWKAAVTIDILSVELGFVRLTNQIIFQLSHSMDYVKWFGKNFFTIIKDYLDLMWNFWTGWFLRLAESWGNLWKVITGKMSIGQMFAKESKMVVDQVHVLNTAFKNLKGPEIGIRVKGSLEQSLGSALSGAQASYSAGLSKYMKTQNHKSAAPDDTTTGNHIALAPGAVIPKAVRAHVEHHLKLARAAHQAHQRSAGGPQLSVNGAVGAGISGVAAAFASAHQNQTSSARTAAATAKTAQESSASRKLLETIAESLSTGSHLIAGVLKGV